jgi:hypothetical protein
MSFTPVVIECNDLLFAAVFETANMLGGIDALLNAYPPSHTEAAKKIFIGPASSAADALLYNEAREKKLVRTKRAVILRTDDYGKKRKRAMQDRK